MHDGDKDEREFNLNSKETNVLADPWGFQRDLLNSSTFNIVMANLRGVKLCHMDTSLY